MSKPLLSIRNLHTFFASEHETVHAVRGVSFDVNEGEMIGIVGESGCGKSALAKSIMRLNDPKRCSMPAGSISFRGVDLLGISEQDMRAYRGKEMSMIFQDPLSSLNPTMRIGEQIVEAFLIHNHLAHRDEAIQRTLRLLELVGIPQAESRFRMYPHELSGGMRQRVMIAIAMICNPHLLIADEPTTALDSTVQLQIIELLKSLETTIIMISHDISVISALCDRVLVMYGGKIVEDAPKEELFTTPKHPYTQKLLQTIPTLNTTILEAIDGSPPDLTKHEKGCPFAERCPMVMPICRDIPPVLNAVSDKHKVSCHLTQPKIMEYVDEYTTTVH